MQGERNPWKTLSSRTVYDNAWIRVEEHEVVNPSGGRNRYGKVCFKNRAVGVIALDAAGRVYLVGQTRYTLGEYSWELPMGGAPLDEDPLAAAQRELREETGLSAARWRELIRVHTSNSITDEVGIVYVAEGLTAGEQELEETEDLAVDVVPFAEAYRRVLDGRITDAISVAGILRLSAERPDFLRAETTSEASADRQCTSSTWTREESGGAKAGAPRAPRPGARRG